MARPQPCCWGHVRWAKPPWRGRLRPIASYEGHVLETLLQHIGPGRKPHFYRTHDGAEIDLLLSRGGQPDVAIEVKRTSAPPLDRGFGLACDSLCFSLRHGAQAIGLNELVGVLNTDASKPCP